MKPFSNAFFKYETGNGINLPLSKLGSGYEMFFALIYSYFLSKENKKDLIILIDEPELHLHPSLQKIFLDFLIDISKNSQIIITTHSPLLLKQALVKTKKIKTFILKKDGDCAEELDMSKKVLNYI